MVNGNDTTYKLCEQSFLCLNDLRTVHEELKKEEEEKKRQCLRCLNEALFPTEGEHAKTTDLP